MEIYIKPKKKAALVNKNRILIGDVAGVAATGVEAKAVEMLLLKSLETSEAPGKKSSNHLISVMDIIKKIKAEYPGAAVSNVGEPDTWVHCKTQTRRPSRLFMWLRVAFVSLVLLTGAATAIMSFHTDGQIPKIFERYHEIIYGTSRENPPIIAIPYSIGLAVGIIAFYNHILGKKLTDDPTPIEVEITEYEKEVTETMVDMMEKQEKGGTESGNA